MVELGATQVPVVRVNLSKEDEKELNVRLNKNTGEFDFDIMADNFDIEDLLEWGFKHIDLGLNIDKIEEDKPTTITIKEKDIKLANKLYEDLKAQGYKVSIK